MGYREKINIYVPNDIGMQLANDIMLFEIFKRDGRTVNKNRFLTMLLCGYYDHYLIENKKVYDQILNVLENTRLTVTERNDVAHQLLNMVFLPSIPKRKGKKPICFSLKPTSKTERIIDDIENQLKGTDFVSQYFCKMLMSYCSKPIFERERIVFKDNYETLQAACIDKQSVVFSVIWDEGKQHEVIPYTLVSGKEGMFNYLLCDEINPITGLSEAKSYRLNRITRIGHGHRTEPISEVVKQRCDKAIAFAPQYAINSDDDICVRLTDVGEKLYNRIYYGRPKYFKIEDLVDGHYYYFNSSPMQIFHYFRRFDNNTAIILAPVSLKEKMIDFHRKSLMAYEATEKEVIKHV